MILEYKRCLLYSDGTCRTSTNGRTYERTVGRETENLYDMDYPFNKILPTEFC